MILNALSLRAALASTILSALTVLPAAAERDPSRLRTIVLISGCKDTTLNVLLVHSTRKEQWQKNAWYKLYPEEVIVPEAYGEALKHRDNANLIYYAWSGNTQVTGTVGINYEGEHYKGRKAQRFLRGKYVEAEIGWDDC